MEWREHVRVVLRLEQGVARRDPPVEPGLALERDEQQPEPGAGKAGAVTEDGELG